MSVDWESEKDIFGRALEVAVDERDKFLDEACGGDTELKSEIARLIAYHSRGQEFFFRLEREFGAADVQTPLLADGEVVANRFEISRFLARGGFAEVYEALDRELEERVALKVMRGAWISGEAIELFKSEVRLVRRIQNNHVCRVHDVGRCERPDGPPVLFFSMELLEGETLAEYLRCQGPLAKPEAFAILRQLAEGLQSAHRLGMLHRDLKPANVMLAREAEGSLRAVITDFGLAITDGRNPGQTLAGTPGYMAPEQLERRPLTARTDIYALGVVAYEMVTGHRLPSPSASFIERNQGGGPNDPLPLSEIRAPAGRRWERAILKCLSRNPEDRFGAVSEFIAALEGPRSALAISTILFTVALAGSGLWAWNLRNEGHAVPSGSILVIPFELDGGMDQWQGDAFSSDLAAELADVPGIRVVAQSTAREWAGKVTSLAEIRRQLRVASVLSGSIRGKAGGMRVTIQLADSASGYMLWSRSFDATPKDLPHIEETIVLASAGVLQVRVPALQVATIQNRHSEIFPAYQAYSFGLYCLGRRNTQDLEQAIDSFRKAISLDPNYALAHAGLGAAFNLIASRGTMAREEAFRLSDEAANQALALAPDLPEALLVKGSNLQYGYWDWDGAERYYRRCAKIAPGSSTAHHWLAGLLSIRGRHSEALAEAAQARELDPLSPSINASFGTFLYRARRYEEAAAQLEWIVKRDPPFMNAKLLLADIYSQTGRPAQAIPLAETVVAADGRASYALAELGYHYARAGRLQEARQILAELESRFGQGDGRASEIAFVYLGLSESDSACDWLMRGLPLRDAGLMDLKVDPAYDTLRVYPRFRNLIEMVGL